MAFKDVEAKKEYQRNYTKNHPEKFNKPSLRSKFASIIGNAKPRGLEVTYTIEEYSGLISGATCFYCSGSLPLTGSGVDRLNHEIGYVKGNLVPCCSSCNRKKGYLEGMGFKYPRTVELMKELHRVGNH